MTATNYIYSIQQDFLNHKVDTTRLLADIRVSAIVTAVDYITTNGDVCEIWFKGAMSQDDKIILDELIGTHSGEPLEPIPQVMWVKIVE